MFHLYLDESGETGINYDDAEQPYFFISGFIVKEDQLDKLGTDIQDLKQSIGLAKDQEIHTSNIRGNQLTLLYEGLWPVIEGNCIKVVNTGFNKKDLNEMYLYCETGIKKFSDSQKKIIPYIYGAYLTMLNFNHFLKDQGVLGKIFLDEKRSDHAKVKKIFFRFANRELLGNPISCDIVSLDYLDSKKSAFIQIADILAYTFCYKQKILNISRENFGERENTIDKAYDDLEKCVIKYEKFGIGELLPAVLSDEILAKIANLILKEVR